MPYTDSESRIVTQPFSIQAAQTPGELGFQINALILSYVQNKISEGVPAGFTLLSTPLGVLDSIAREYYRRVMVPFENEKCAVNGDVYGELLARMELLDIHHRDIISSRRFHEERLFEREQRSRVTEQGTDPQ